MPVPQRVNFIVEQASCLFLIMVQYLSLEKVVLKCAKIVLVKSSSIGK